jgi:ubiquinone/menaquinone biosynthesis C-methylase UbiE
MEERKIKEIEYYNKEALESKDETKESGSLAGLNPMDLSSYKFLYELVQKYCKNKKVLDFGCGIGMHLIPLAKIAGQTIGIDLSEESVNIALRRIDDENLTSKATAIIMDCEKLRFNNNSFDVVFDGGTFSSLDLDKALIEIKRVLKPGGILVGIETFGHNPLTNIKRKFNKTSGRRTSWASEHIFNNSGLAKASAFFKVKEMNYFHLVSWAAFPFVKYSWGGKFLKIMEGIDKNLINIFPFFKKYSFKIVFVLQKP